MKFYVTKNYSGTVVDVRLHHETKDKIRKIFFYSVGAAGAASIAWGYVTDKIDFQSLKN